MAIEFTCSHCGQRHRTAETNAGKKSHCRNERCGKQIVVPIPSATQAKPKNTFVSADRRRPNAEAMQSDTTPRDRTRRMPEHDREPEEFEKEYISEQAGESETEAPPHDRLFLSMSVVLGSLLAYESYYILGHSSVRGSQALAIVAISLFFYLLTRGFLRAAFPHRSRAFTLLSSVDLLIFWACVGMNARADRGPVWMTKLPGFVTFFEKDGIGRGMLLIYKYGLLFLAGLATIADIRELREDIRLPRKSNSEEVDDQGAQEDTTSRPVPRRRRKPALPSWLLPYRIAASPTVDGPVQLGSLQPISLRQNWNPGEFRLPNYLIRDRGALIEPIASDFVSEIEGLQNPQLTQGLVAEAVNDSGHNRALRFALELQPGHITATDVYLQSQGRDLYVRFDTKSWTLISLFNRTLRASMAVFLFLVFFVSYFNYTGAKVAWVKDFAAKYAKNKNSNHSAQNLELDILFGSKVIDVGSTSSIGRSLTEALQREQVNFFSRMSAVNLIELGTINPNGQTLNEALDIAKNYNLYFDYVPQAGLYQHSNGWLKDLLKWLEENHSQHYATIYKDLEIAYRAAPINAQPWSYYELFIKDPKLAMTNQGLIPLLIAIGTSAFAIFLPPTFLFALCRRLGWPTPDRFGNTVQAHKAQIERTLSDVLFNRYGVHEGEIIDVSSR